MALGVNHPDILNNLLSEKQLAEWEIFYSLESFGEKAEWERVASILAFYTNANSKKGSKKAGLEKFMPKYFFREETRQQQSMDDMKNVLNTLMNRKKR